MAPQIDACRDKGKVVALSLGGEIAQIGFAPDDHARVSEDKTWDSFLDDDGSGGHPRPFGDAVLNEDPYPTTFIFRTLFRGPLF
jgi:hypothetical protein